MSLRDKTKSMLSKVVESKWNGYMERKKYGLPGEACQQAEKKKSRQAKLQNFVE